MATARYYAQPSNSVRHLYGVSLDNAKAIAKEWSLKVKDTVTVYRDTGTGFDPVVVRYKRGKIIFDQSKYI